MRQVIGCLVVGLFAGTLWADEFSEKRQANWHQFRGPEATGVAPMGNPPVEWSETKNIKWKVAIPGRGSASPIIWGDKIFILTAIKTDRTAPGAEAAVSAPKYQSGRSPIRRASCWPSGRKIAMASAEATDVVVEVPVAVAAVDGAAVASAGANLRRIIISSSSCVSIEIQAKRFGRTRRPT